MKQIRNTVLIAVALFALLTVTAHAEEWNGLRLDPDDIQLHIGVSGVVHRIEPGVPGSNLRGELGMEWKLSKRFSLLAGVERDFSPADLTNWNAGGGARLAGAEPTDALFLFTGAYFVHREGDGAESFHEVNSWETFLAGGVHVARTEAGRPWLAVLLTAQYDRINEFPTGSIGLRATGF